jgi:hypothetical protein
MKTAPHIRKHLLWEYHWPSVDFTRLATVVIERIIERGTILEWREMVRFYGKEKILEAARKSTRLDRKHKQFTPLFLDSAFINDDIYGERSYSA